MKLLRILLIVATGIFLYAGSLEGQVTGTAVSTQTRAPASQNHGLKGAPFSANVIHETSRVLADGTQIRQETHGKSLRDSEGRTRLETEYVMSTGEKRQHVSIVDPVERVSISLEPDKKLATIHPWPPAPSAETPKPAASAPQSTHEELGTTEIEGFAAAGIRYTRTIEAGKIGNDKPLVTIDEMWYSSDLKTVLQSKVNDPEYGEKTMKLVNIQRSEPDPSLFQIPPGYTVNDTRPKN